MDLSKKKCKPFEGAIAPLDQQKVEGYLKQIMDGWKVTNKILREFLFVNFKHKPEQSRTLSSLFPQNSHF